MGKYTVTDPQSGKTVSLTGDSPPTEQELNEVFAKIGGGTTGNQTNDSYQASILPRFTQAQDQGKGLGSKILGGALDVLSLPGRGLAAIPAAFQGENTVGQTKENTNENGVAQFMGNTLRDPATLATLPIGGPEVMVGGSIVKSLGAAALQGLKQGAVSGLAHQTENVVDNGKADLGQFAQEAALGGGLGLLGKSIPALAKGYNAVTGKIASGATGVSEEALRMAGTKEGRRVLQNAAGTEPDIGAALVDKMSNAYKTIREGSAQIQGALDNTPAVNVVPMIKSLENAAGNPVTQEAKSAADLINGKVNELRQLTSQSGDGGFVNAKDLYNFRKEIDDIIGDQFGQSSGTYVRALKGLRSDIKNGLLGAAKGTEYETGMQDLAGKLDALDKMKKMLGQNVTTQEGRSESFVRNINNMGKSKQREWLNNFENEFGGNTTDEAKNAQLARQIGDNGTAGWLPQHFTGKSVLGIAAGSALHTPILGLAMSSPKVASQAILPATQAAQDITGYLGGLPMIEQTGRVLSQGLRSNLYNR